MTADAGDSMTTGLDSAENAPGAADTAGARAEVAASLIDAARARDAAPEATPDAPAGDADGMHDPAAVFFDRLAADVAARWEAADASVREALTPYITAMLDEADITIVRENPESRFGMVEEQSSTKASKYEGPIIQYRTPDGTFLNPDVPPLRVEQPFEGLDDAVDAVNAWVLVLQVPTEAGSPARPVAVLMPHRPGDTAPGWQTLHPVTRMAQAPATDAPRPAVEGGGVVLGAFAVAALLQKGHALVNRHLGDGGAGRGRGRS